MTTIATDGDTMAADTLVTGNGLIHGHMTKLRRADNGDIIGATGTAFDLDHFATWYNSDQNEPVSCDENFEALVLTTDKEVFCYNHQGRRIRHSVPACSGSGAGVAYGALEAGCSPCEAVAIAARRDMGTGGPIDVMKPG